MQTCTQVSFGPAQKLPANFKVCVECRHFRVERQPHLGRCQLFGHIDCVTGVKELSFASTARISHDMCGRAAKHFELLLPEERDARDAQDDRECAN